MYLSHNVIVKYNRLTKIYKPDLATDRQAIRLH